MNADMPLADLPDAVAAMLGRLQPRSEAEYRAHIAQTQIMPSLGRWGFERRFLAELPEMHPKQRKAFDDLRGHMAGRGAIVALIGPRGLGKTSLCAQFAIELAWKNFHEAQKAQGPRHFGHCIYKKTAKLVGRYKPIFSDFGTIEGEGLLESLDYLCRQQEFLVIDELHECDDLKNKHRVVTDIVDRRYAACRDTILIANQSLEDFAAACGDSIISRLSEHGCIIACDWPSYRSAQ